MRLFKPALALLAALLTLSACDDKKRTDVSTATLVCDNSFENIMKQEIDVFEYVHPKNFILCRYVPQAEAFDSLFKGNTRTAVVGRDLTKDERISLKKKYPNLRSMKIAVDAVALITNPENRVDMVSLSELRDILEGRTTRWSELSPMGDDRNINVVFDSQGSGLATFMRDSVMGGAKFGPNVTAAGSIDSVFSVVKHHKGAIGVIGVSWLTRDLEVDTTAMAEKVKELQSDKAVVGQEINDRMDASGVNVLAVMNSDARACKPYQQYIYDGSYPLTRPIYMITTGSPVGAVGRFYTFVTSTEGQKLIMKTGILPARMQVNVYEVSTAGGN
ncbi:MAG: substrate-binding domain-containing protein [Muribaculaceae bacterium]|nr:substrate-binding domain-containing protein [Muribaculaceae bacterium]